MIARLVINLFADNLHNLVRCEIHYLTFMVEESIKRNHFSSFVNEKQNILKIVTYFNTYDIAFIVH